MTKTAPAWLRPAIVALAAFLLIACFSTEVADSDTFWHLKTGQCLVEQHKLPLPALQFDVPERRSRGKKRFGRST